MGGTGSDPDATVVDVERDERIVVALGLPALGALAGLGLKLIAGWVAGLAWAPFQGPFKLVASIDEPWATVGALGVGLAGGLVLTALSIQERLTVMVTDDTVTLARGATTTTYQRSDVDSAFMDGKALVLLDRSGAELARERSDLRPDRIAAALRGHGYAWRDDGDPYRNEFRLWVPDMPGLPPAANALLAARARALEKKAQSDVAELRVELLRLGVVVRDDQKRQYWRVVPSLEG